MATIEKYKQEIHRLFRLHRIYEKVKELHWMSMEKEAEDKFEKKSTYWTRLLQNWY
jgi:hypothetical protein